MPTGNFEYNIIANDETEDALRSFSRRAEDTFEDAAEKAEQVGERLTESLESSGDSAEGSLEDLKRTLHVLRLLRELLL